MTPNRKAFLIALLCFFISGASGLMYQVVWARQLTLIFGATTFAISTVLTVFMGGLALGSYYGGRRNAVRPLRTYGLLEISIGLYGLLIPAIFAVMPQIYGLAKPLPFLAVSLMRFALAVLVLALPTGLMGATLPILSKFFASGGLIGLRVGSLYSANTFGAVAGSLASGFLLMPALGMRATTIVAAGLNIAIGLIALGLDRRLNDGPSWPAEPAAIRRSPPPKKISPAQVKLALAAFALSGLVALSYEVIWSRVLALIIGSSVYAFTIMVATFLVGLAAGAYLASRFADRAGDTIRAFALIEAGIGATALAGSFFFNELPYFFVRLYGSIAVSSFELMLAVRFLIAALIMIPPTLFLGSLLPIVVRIVHGGAGDMKRSISRVVGDAYAANTLGAIVGSFASGFVMIPNLGLTGSLKLCVAVNFALGAALAWSCGRRLAASLAVAFGLMVILIRAPWDPAIMSSAVYRYAPAMKQMNRQEFFKYMRQGETIFYKEGVTATVTVQRQGADRVLKVNGKPEASTMLGDLPTQILMGSLPLLVRQSAEDVLVIGLGSGTTLGSVEQFPISRVTCVELEPAVIEASRFFNDINNRPLEDPRLRLIQNDGRNFIDTAREQFDVIISQPSNPWLTGVANLFTLEYFRRGAQRLKPGGTFTQWLQIYEMPIRDVKSLLATFRAVFPNTMVFRAAEGDLVLLGSQAPLKVDISVISAHLGREKIARNLKRAGIEGAADLISHFYLGPEEAARFSTGAPINTDDNALIEFSAPRLVGVGQETIEQNLDELIEYAAGSGHHFDHGFDADPLIVLQADARARAEFLSEAALGAIRRNDTRRAEHFCRYSLQIAQTAQARSILGEIMLSRGDQRAALEEWNRALGLDPNHFYTLINLGKLYLMRGDLELAAAHLDRALKLQPDSARARHLRGLVYQAAGDNARAVQEYWLALSDAQYVRSVKTFHLNFGVALAATGSYQEAAVSLEEYTRLAPEDPEGHYQLGAVYEVIAERSGGESTTYRAIESLKRAISLRPNHAMSHYYLSKTYRRLGLYELAEAEFELYERLLAR